LPVELTPLIGRDSDVADVCELVCTNNGRLVTLMGQGGMGKTRLALAVAHRFTYAFLDGVFWIDLAETTQTADLPTAIARQINLPLHDQQEPLNQLLAYLQDKECLLALDNFEQLLTDESIFHFLLNLLEKCPAARLLITSRSRLKLRHEAGYPLHPLPYPKTGLAEQLFAPRPYPAVQLFVQAAQRIDHHFRLEPAQEAVQTICQLLEGLPLGIELAASLIDQQSGAEIAAAIAHNLDALATEMADLPPRQRGLRAMFAYSWALLTADDQATLAGLSTFLGEFTAETALAVTGGTAEALAHLRQQSLLRHNGENGRYSLHEAIRFYAQEQLARQPLGEQVTRNYIRHYLGALGQYETALFGLEAKTAVLAIQQKFTNIAQAWHYAVAAQQWPLLRASLTALRQYAEIGGHSREILPLLAKAIAGLEAIPDSDANLHGRLLVEQGRALGRLGQQADGLPHIEAGVQLLARGDDWATLAHGEMAWGKVLWHLGHYDEAETHIERAMANGRLANLPLIQIKGLRLTGNLLFVRGRHQQAQAQFSQAVALSRQHNWPRQTATCLNNLAAACYHLGDYVSARQTHIEALQLHQALGNEFGTALSLGNLGDVYLQEGELETAETYYRDSLRLRQKIGDRMGEGWVQHALGRLYQQMGDWAQARTSYEQSLMLRRRTQDQREIAESHNSLGVLFRLEEATEQAAHHHAQALAIYTQLGDQFSVAMTHYYWAQTAVDQQDWAAVAACLEKSLAIFYAIDNKQRIMDCLSLQEQVSARQ
jgi:predicted ATPase/Flp pilus assembly protein TadD